MSDQNKYYPLSDEEQLRKKLGGMTVIERLYETGQLEDYDKASEAKDVATVRLILESIFVDEPSIQMVLDKL